MIVLIDAEAGKVIVCDEQTREYSINDINSIAAAISGKEVYYVTSADMASGDEVVGLLSQITGKFPNPSEITTIQPTDEGEFLHPSKNRQIIIIGTDGREFQFRGIFDFKRLSSVPPEVMESEQMQMFLQSGVIEKVDAQRKKEIVSEFEVRTSERRKRQQAQEDSILVKDSTPGAASKAAVDGIANGEEDIAPEISISGEVSFKREDHSEHHQNMKNLGL